MLRRCSTQTQGELMRNLFVRMVLLLAAVALPAIGQEQKVPPVDAAEGIAIKGYDTVAYFEQSQAVKGSPSFEYTWNGAKWLFATRLIAMLSQKIPRGTHPNRAAIARLA
jgi:hypothetical protein